jgi:hypothetical protein
MSKPQSRASPGLVRIKLRPRSQAIMSRAHHEQVGYRPSLAPTARFHRRCKPHCNRSWHLRISRQRRLPQRETAWASIARRARCSRRDRGRCEGTGHPMWYGVVKATTVKCDPGVGAAVRVKALPVKGKTSTSHNRIASVAGKSHFPNGVNIPQLGNCAFEESGLAFQATEEGVGTRSSKTRAS